MIRFTAIDRAMIPEKDSFQRKITGIARATFLKIPNLEHFLFFFQIKKFCAAPQCFILAFRHQAMPSPLQAKPPSPPIHGTANNDENTSSIRIAKKIPLLQIVVICNLHEGEINNFFLHIHLHNGRNTVRQGSNYLFKQ